jgi:hypothetical protein
VNRKLIRPNLAELKVKEFEQPAPRPPGKKPQNQSKPAAHKPVPQSASPPKKSIPPLDTAAEVFYYKKQIEAQTKMVIVLQDGEEITGAIEWYDRNALKVNRSNAPNIMLLRHNIKYMYKAG